MGKSNHTISPISHNAIPVTLLVLSAPQLLMIARLVITLTYYMEENALPTVLLLLSSTITLVFLVLQAVSLVILLPVKYVLITLFFIRANVYLFVLTASMQIIR